MRISWNWLKDYISLDGLTPQQVADWLITAGLYVETIDELPNDIVLDVEVTSNRPDCLGHVGIAREIGVLFDRILTLKDPKPASEATKASELTKVQVESPELCPRYIARVIRGVKVGPSPAWLIDRLAAMKIGTVNNVVDITNYVLMECGQPLHAFDLQKLHGQRIVVRRPKKGEKLEAIDHKVYEPVDPSCVICDEKRPVAIAGVMGGADTEITPATTDVLIEAADFAPMSVRTTARALVLHSPSSYRFERGVDPRGVDWASRRCCELILQICGGKLAEGSVEVGSEIPARDPITLRWSQVTRILGIEVPQEKSKRILRELGCREIDRGAGGDELVVVPPSWRRDLDREIDLIEEIARIHGYDNIPENVAVAMAPSHRSQEDRVLAAVRQVLVAAGYCEAMTISFVSKEWSEGFTPWSAEPPLSCDIPLLLGADRLRRSLIPSLLGALRGNETVGNKGVQLFETAHAYLPRPGTLPEEPRLLTLVSQSELATSKGVVEALLRRLDASLVAQWHSWSHPLVAPGRGIRLEIGGQIVGFLGELSPAGRKHFELQAKASFAELRLDVIGPLAKLISQHQPVPTMPAISEDLNLIVENKVRWSDLAATVSAAGAPLLERLDYKETFRDEKKDGPGRKRLIFSFLLRAKDRTLTGDEAKSTREKILAAVAEKHGAVLLK